MKYLKQYEELNQKDPEIGDYVICSERYMNNNFTEEENINYEFLENNVGRYVKFQTGNYLIQYENIPPRIKDYYNHDDDMTNTIPNVRRMHRNEIVVFSPNKEELEILMAQNKFNL